MTLQLIIPNIACSACINTVTEVIHMIDPTATVQANTRTKRVDVQTQASAIVIKEAIAIAGYPAA